MMTQNPLVNRQFANLKMVIYSGFTDLPIKNGDFPLPEGSFSNFDPFSSHWVPYPPQSIFEKSIRHGEALGNSLESALLEQSSDSAQLKRVAAQLSPDVSQDAPGGGGGEGGNLGTGGDAAGICR